MRKGILCLGLMAAAVIGLFSLSAWAVKEPVTAADATSILSRLSDGTDNESIASGCDAALILQYVVGLIDHIPVEEQPDVPEDDPEPEPHTHTWITDETPEVGHYESRLTGYEDGEPIYDIESVWIGSVNVCNACGAEFSFPGEISDHFNETDHNGYHAKDLYETHEVIIGYKQVPVYADVWIVDIPASTRTYCSVCGEEK